MQNDDKIKNAFLAIIDEILAQPDFCRKAIICTEKGAAFPGSLSMEYIGITFILSGQQNTTYYSGGKLVRDIMEPSKVFLYDRRCHNAIDWELPCRRLGIAVRENWLGMSWNYHRFSGGHPAVPDLWFQVFNLGHHHDIFLLLKTLVGRVHFPSDSLLTRELIRGILHKMQEVLQDEAETPLSSARSTYENICSYLGDNFQLPINRKTVAALFKLNPDYVTRLFKEQGQTAFSDYLTWLRLRHAEVMIREENLTIAEVAAACGYNNVSYFIKAFRKKYNVSPGHYAPEKIVPELLSRPEGRSRR